MRTITALFAALCLTTLAACGDNHEEDYHPEESV